MVLLIVKNVDKGIEINFKETLLHAHRGCLLHDFTMGCKLQK